MDTEKSIKYCNELLKDELSAIETYDQAISKYAGTAEASTLRSIRQEHVQNAEVLRAQIVRLGGRPTQDSGVWGSFAKTMQGGSELLGKSTAVKALLMGERKGLEDYEDALRRDDMMPEFKSDIRDVLLPRQTKHISTLERLA